MSCLLDCGIHVAPEWFLILNRAHSLSFHILFISSFFFTQITLQAAKTIILTDHGVVSMIWLMDAVELCYYIHENSQWHWIVNKSFQAFFSTYAKCMGVGVRWTSQYHVFILRACCKVWQTTAQWPNPNCRLYLCYKQINHTFTQFNCAIITV